MLSTMRKNTARACPTGIELLGPGFRAHRPVYRVVDVHKHPDAAIPFVAVTMEPGCRGTTGCMSREQLLQTEAAGKGPRFRFMKNEQAVRHWSKVYAATEEQLNLLEDPNDDRVCLLVGPVVQGGISAGQFPVDCLVWMEPGFSPPGEVHFSWLAFYPGMRDDGEASNSTWRRRAARSDQLRPGVLSVCPALDEKEPPARALGDTAQDKCGSEPREECVICMDCEAAYAWEACDHFRPLLCSGCVRLSSVARTQTSCVVCRTVSRLAAYTRESDDTKLILALARRPLGASTH